MSLINRVLQDLDARRAGEAATVLRNEVRPLPAEPRRAHGRWAVAAGAAIAAAGGIYLALRAPSGPGIVPAPPPAVQPISAPATVQQAMLAPPAAPPAPVEAAAPASPEPSPVSTPPAPAGGEAPPAAPEANADRTEKSAPQAAAAPGRLKLANVLQATPAERGERPQVSAAGPAAAPARAEGSGRVVIEKQPRSGTAHERAEGEYRRALTAVNQGRVNEAVATLRAALELEAGHVTARLTLAGLLVEQKRLDEAQTVLMEGLVASPRQVSIATRLARVQVELGDLRGAAQSLQLVAAEAAGNAEFRGLHAAVLQRLGRHREATEEYRAALRLSPQSGVWWMGLGLSLEAEGQDAAAREAFQKARASGTLAADVDRFVEQRIRQLP